MDALKKLENHDPAVADNLLIGRMFALNAISDSKLHLKVIYPLFVGERCIDVTTGDVSYGEDIFDHASSAPPDIIPQKSIADLQDRLKEHGLIKRHHPQYEAQQMN